MYQFLINTYKDKPCNSTDFELMMNYYVKNNNFKQVKNIISTVQWKSPDNYRVLQNSINLCIFYKKPSFKLFSFLIDNNLYPEYQDYSISSKAIKDIHLKDLIKDCFYWKPNFIKELLKQEKSDYLIGTTIQRAIQLNKQLLAIEVLEHFESPVNKDAFIKNSIKFKRKDLVEYYCARFDGLKSFISYKYDQFPNQPEKYYHFSILHAAKISQFNIEHIDNKIKDFFKGSTVAHFKQYMLKTLADRNFKSFDKWSDMYFSKTFSFDKFFINRSLEDMSVRALSKIYKFNQLNQYDSLDSANFNSCLSSKIITGLKHGKTEYLLKIKELFNLDNILFNLQVKNYYYENLDLIKPLPFEELPILSLEEKIKICYNNLNHKPIFKLIEHHPWEDIQSCLINNHKSDLISTFNYQYMQLNLIIKQKRQKIKI